MGFIHLLPALPDAWKDGEVKGLCAKGNFELDIRWTNGELKEMEIRSKNGGPCEVRYKDAVIKLKTVKGKNYTVKNVNGQLKSL
jgi:alpha-L-fucosidase 2